MLYPIGEGFDGLRFGLLPSGPRSTDLSGVTQKMVGEMILEELMKFTGSSTFVAFEFDGSMFPVETALELACGEVFCFLIFGLVLTVRACENKG